MKRIKRRDSRTDLIVTEDRWYPEVINEVSMGSQVHMTPVVANNVLYIATRDMLYAIHHDQQAPQAANHANGSNEAAD